MAFSAEHELSLMLKPTIAASVRRKQIRGWWCHQSLVPAKPSGGRPVLVRT
jgi:hypothetical protein